MSEEDRDIIYTAYLLVKQMPPSPTTTRVMAGLKKILSIA